jgi:hypothetical protein
VQTALKDNAAVISKQASKYSSQCGLVLLSNYQDSILLDFTTSPGNTPWNDLTHPVQYLFTTGTGNGVLTHKQLLTAALIYGMRKAGVIGPNGEQSRSHNIKH